MQRLVFVILGVIFAGAIAYSVLESRKAPPPEHGGTTNERLSDVEMERLAERPMDLVERGDLAGGKRQFELEFASILKRKGERSLTPGDMLTAFGLGLRREEHDTEAIPYFRRAVAAYRTAVGPNDPELALALHTLADSIYDNPRDPQTAPPPDEVMAAMNEALRIRRASLGPNNAETAITYVRLGRLNGHPALTAGDEVRVDAAARQARYGLELLPNCPNLDPVDISIARRTVVEIYARNGRTREVIEALPAYMRGEQALNHGNVVDFSEMLKAAGDPEGAAEVRRRFGND
jgi:hypothetical protein